MITVILPCYDEDQLAVFHTLAILRATLPEEAEYIVLENGSQKLIMNGSGARYYWKKKRGLGWALKTGIELASFNDVYFFGADLPIDSAKFYEQVKQNPGDIVSASKRHPESKVNRPLIRKIWTEISTFGLQTMHPFMQSNDPGSAGRYFNRAKVLPLLKFCPSNGLFFDSELLTAASRAKLKLVEVPCEVNDRSRTLSWLS